MKFSLICLESTAAYKENQSVHDNEVFVWILFFNLDTKTFNDFIDTSQTIYEIFPISGEFEDVVIIICDVDVSVDEFWLEN